MPKLLIFLLFLVSCSGGENVKIHSQQQVAPVLDNTLEPGDLFEVRVYGEKGLSGQYRVSSNGTMDFPLIGSVMVAGMTPSQVKQTLEKALFDGQFLRDPQISILVKDFASKKVSVLGEINKPGTFSYHDGMGVVEAISLAGGFTPMARTSNTTITRVVDGEKRNFIIPVEDIGQGKISNFMLRAGDIIFVPERIF